MYLTISLHQRVQKLLRNSQTSMLGVSPVACPVPSMSLTSSQALLPPPYSIKHFGKREVVLPRLQLYSSRPYQAPFLSPMSGNPIRLAPGSTRPVRNGPLGFTDGTADAGTCGPAWQPPPSAFPQYCRAPPAPTQTALGKYLYTAAGCRLPLHPHLPSTSCNSHPRVILTHKSVNHAMR